MNILKTIKNTSNSQYKKGKRHKPTIKTIKQRILKKPINTYTI